MLIKVYEVGNEIELIEINKEQQRNIEKIFTTLQKEQHLVTECYLNQASIHYKKSPIYYMNEINLIEDHMFDKVAKDLLLSESKKDGTRNSTIKEGLLFIKMKKPDIIIMKLEKMSVIDSTTFAYKKELGSEKNYFKSCIFRGDYGNIRVIDKNKTAAKYWYEEFLKLSKKRTDEDNTSELINLIKNDKLFKQKITNSDTYRKIKKHTELFILSNKCFDKTELMNELNTENMIDLSCESDIYSDDAINIDTDFFLNQKIINNEYQLEIQTSDDVVIKTKNYLYSYQDGKIEFDEKNKMITILVDEYYLDSVKEKLQNGE